MDEKIIADETVVPAATTEETTAVVESEPSQKTPVEEELERVQRAPSKRTKLEKLEFTKQRLDAQIAEERKAAGIEVDEEDKPLTLRDLKLFREQEAIETAHTLTESITDESERKLAQYHLDNTIRPSGNAQTDFENALALVNAVKHKELAEDALRARPTRTSASTAGAPIKYDKEPVFTPEEQKMMRPPFNLTKEQIIKAREV